jgi:hypothetical protein
MSFVDPFIERWGVCVYGGNFTKDSNINDWLIEKNHIPFAFSK